MKIVEPRTYEIEIGYIKLIRIGSWFFLGFVLLTLAFLFKPDEIQSQNFTTLYIVLGASFLGFLSWYMFRITKQIPFSSVTIDTDGIWPSHKEKKETLIPWQAITNIKERTMMQRLDLIGREGTTLLRIEYQLSRFNELRAQLIERIEVDLKQYQYLPVSFSKIRIYHLLYFSCLFGFTWIGLHIRQADPFIGYGVIAIIALPIGYEYLTEVWRLSVYHHGLIVQYPILSRHIQYSDIITVDLSDRFIEGVWHPEVHILLKNISKPIKLRKLGVDAVLLYKILTGLIEEKSNCL